MNTEQRHFLEACRKRYIDDLTGDIMPFWLDHGLDRVYGGVYTCLDRDGTLMDTTKSVWFQGRFAYVCASAFNKIEQAPQWIEASKSALDFIEAHCRDTDGHMFFTVTETGGPVQKRRYVFSECFLCGKGRCGVPQYIEDALHTGIPAAQDCRALDRAFHHHDID